MVRDPFIFRLPRKAINLKAENEALIALQLIHGHICLSCGRASRREDPDGMPDAAGVFHCSQCGHQGSLNEAVIEETDERLRR